MHRVLPTQDVLAVDRVRQQRLADLRVAEDRAVLGRVEQTHVGPVAIGITDGGVRVGRPCATILPTSIQPVSFCALTPRAHAAEPESTVSRGCAHTHSTICRASSSSYGGLQRHRPADHVRDALRSACTSSSAAPQPRSSRSSRTRPRRQPTARPAGFLPDQLLVGGRACGEQRTQRQRAGAQRPGAEHLPAVDA